VAIRLRCGDGPRADRAAATARAILHDDALPEHGRQTIRHQAGHHVGAAGRNGTIILTM
jgi:hypothetical protein